MREEGTKIGTKDAERVRSAFMQQHPGDILNNAALRFLEKHEHEPIIGHYFPQNPDGERPRVTKRCHGNEYAPDEARDGGSQGERMPTSEVARNIKCMIHI